VACQTELMMEIGECLKANVLNVILEIKIKPTDISSANVVGNSRSINCGEFARIQGESKSLLPALSSGAMHTAPPQTSIVSFIGCPSKIASDSNLQPSHSVHSLPTNHYIYSLFFIHMSQAPPYAPPANIFSPLPDAKLSLANALSVTVLLGSGATSLLRFDLPLQLLSSNVI
jgi:hypothetical protein